MADAVVERCIEHIAALPTPADLRRRGCRRALPRAARAGAGAGQRPSSRCSTRCSATGSRGRSPPRRPGYLAFIPGGGALSGRARRLHRQHDQPLHRRLAGRAGAGAARSQRPRLAARLDGVSARTRAACSPPAARWPRSTPSCARANGTWAPRSAAACSTPPIRRTTRCSSRRSWPASCPIACARSRPTSATACRVDLLRAAIAGDRRAGLTPFAVVSSAGTTNTGAVDPLDAIADLCAAEGLWHHVDGAYGAFFYLSERCAPRCAACRAPTR